MYSLDENHNFLIAMLRSLANAAVFKRSANWVLTRIMAAGATDVQSYAKAVQDDLMIDTCTSEDILARHGYNNGVERNGATGARKSAALRVTGTAATVIPAETELTHQSGMVYRIAADATIAASGYVDCDVYAVTTGSATRLDAGETLDFTSTPSGANETAELQLALDEGGEDMESFGSYKNRIIARRRDKPRGNNAAFYVDLAESFDGIASAYCYPNRYGYGSVDIAALHSGTGTARLLTTGEISDLQEYIDDRKPVGIRNCRVLEVVQEPLNVDVEILTNGEPAHAFDWNDSSPPVVSAWNGTTRLLTFTADRPTTMKAGDRICLDTADGTGEQYTIEALSGTDAVILERVPSGAPVATNLVYSGGTTSGLVRDAIVSMFNALGPSNVDGRYGSWNGTLRLNEIAKAALIEGVIDLSIVDPVENTEATDYAYPDDDQIGLIIPDTVLVRKMWG